MTRLHLKPDWQDARMFALSGLLLALTLAVVLWTA